ncbi:MAG: sulfotransferase [Deltaproteobacteria bacterium]|nr:sulfotransferase [Deltaproteobacteria bacterium]
MTGSAVESERVRSLPNFLVIGAIKAGTTALYHYLQQHEQVYLTPVKETRFFSFEGARPDFRGPGDRKLVNMDTICDLDTYAKQFYGVTREIAIGEICPSYLYRPRSAERIQHHTPSVKLIAILRNPIERAFSHYVMRLRDGREPCSSFAEALDDEDRRLRDNWGSGLYCDMGYYGRQLTPYFDRFPRKQIRVYLYEDYLADPDALMADLFRFIGVDETVKLDMSVRHNVAGIIKNPIYRYLWTQTHGIRDLVRPLIPLRMRSVASDFFMNRDAIRPSFPENIRARLAEQFREDIERLEVMIDRDLSHWLQ